MAQAQRDKAIQQAKQYVREDEAKAAGKEVVDADKLKEESDELLDEIDGLLEDQEVLSNYRQRGGQ